ncbi:MAG TPA: response regulator transcription factor [Ferruginibacter sp.]|nr:response regulator transcription factor [Ferruginibacter sp.]HPH91886.1 response regulator transcription factor [Ferruginibacter sp.]
MAINIALTEDNRVNQNTFFQKIKAYPDLKLMFTADNGHECLEELKHLPHHMIPQVIFMDIEMPELNGIETIKIAKALYPQIHFIVLTVFDDDEKIFEAIKVGASGYLLKHEPAAVINDAITNILEFGGAPMSPAIARKAMNLLSRVPQATIEDELTAMPEMITDREQEILQHMINGWDAKRIAVELSLSVLTVRKHIANIYTKLHVTSKAQVISLAHKNNWV